MITPKNNWQNGDVFDFAVDYNRIKSNIAEITAKSNTVNPNKSVAAPLTVTSASYIYSDFFNRIEQAVQDCAEGTAYTFNRRVYAYNQPIWTAADLNRIEVAMPVIAHQLDSADINRQTISITLGGNDFE